jgi:hypothetical protein
VTDVYQHTQIMGWDGISTTFSLDWPLTMIIWVTTSSVAVIVDVSHWTLLISAFKEKK